MFFPSSKILDILLYIISSILKRIKTISLFLEFFKIEELHKEHMRKNVSMASGPSKIGFFGGSEHRAIEAEAFGVVNL